MLTLGVWIASEEVKDKVILSPVLAIVETELLEAMVTLGSVGTVLSNQTADPLLVLVTAVPGLPARSLKLMFRLTDTLSVLLSVMV